MRFLLPLIILLLPVGAYADGWSATLNQKIPHRVLQETYPFDAEYNATVRHHLDGYLNRGRRETERMLSRTAMYFPIIEHYLAQYELPDDLKYIPLLESRMSPTVESPVGAAGLWQFMPATGRHYGLRINDYVDERKNPYLATGAAILMLKQLHTEFEDWALVLAAYNCGPGRVRRAIRRAKCKDYWAIRPYLPRQTQRYVPAMIATIYVAKNYHQYNLRPDFTAHKQQPFRVFKMQYSVRLVEIAQQCRIPYWQLKRLNPGFLENYVPRSSRGHYLILPEEALGRFQQYLAKASRKRSSHYAVAVLDSHYRPQVLNQLEI